MNVVIQDSLCPLFCFLFISVGSDDMCLMNWESVISVDMCHIMGRAENNDIMYYYLALTIGTILV